jgi:hypothetical protein
LGKKTLEGEKAFGEEFKVKGTNADPRFRAKEAQVFVPPSEK